MCGAINIKGGITVRPCQFSSNYRSGQSDLHRPEKLNLLISHTRVHEKPFIVSDSSSPPHSGASVTPQRPPPPPPGWTHAKSECIYGRLGRAKCNAHPSHRHSSYTPSIISTTGPHRTVIIFPKQFECQSCFLSSRIYYVGSARSVTVPYGRGEVDRVYASCP